MNDKSPRWNRTVFVLLGVVVGGLGWWGLQKLWDYAGGLDAQPLPNGVEERLMQRKSQAMHDLLDALVAGELDQVESAADRMEESKRVIQNYLSTDHYEQEREIFYDAIEDVRRSARDGDLDATEEATIRLERSCIDCHMQFNG